MLKPLISKIVKFSVQRAWWIIVLAVLLTTLASTYVASNFTINTNIESLISSDAAWRQRDEALQAAFPQYEASIMVVVDAPTPEFASMAAGELTRRLRENSVLFESVRQADGGKFFTKHSLLFMPTEDVKRITQQLVEGAPLLGLLAADPSLRGLSYGLKGLVSSQFPSSQFSSSQFPSSLYPTLQSSSPELLSSNTNEKTANLAPVLNHVSDVVNTLLDKKPAFFSWLTSFGGNLSENQMVQTRRFILVRPQLDFHSLQPGRAASDAIRASADQLQIKERFNASIRLTGPVPIADDEFGTIKEDAGLNAALTLLAVLAILWFALKSPRLIAAVFVNLFIGLSLTAAVGLWMIGSFNLISIAFAVLFVGLGIDFGIQFAVRYRAERFANNHLSTALENTAKHVGFPLVLAAAATALGFFSFLPTNYRGVSELGQIAGVGMIIAFFSSITILPALLALMRPPGEKAEVGMKAFAPVDLFLKKNRKGVVMWTLLIVICCLPFLAKLKFDFNPINLRDPAAESISTYLQLLNDPNMGANAIEVLAPSLEASRDIKKWLEKLPEVKDVITLENFIPDKQKAKLALIDKAAVLLLPILSQDRLQPAPTDAENVAVLKSTSQMLAQLALSMPNDSLAGIKKDSAMKDKTAEKKVVKMVSPSHNKDDAIQINHHLLIDAVLRLSTSLERLSNASPDIRATAQSVLTKPLSCILNQLRFALNAQPVTLDNLPADLKADWLAPNGRYRIQVLPKGDPNNNKTMEAFAKAVLDAEPNAAGGPISILESGNTIVKAFIEAGVWALLSISLLLWLALRRLSDVALTLVPLLVAGILTLEISAILGLPLNFANIIALPLMLGVGVAFKIYYTVAWRNGQENLLQLPLTRAVILSAAATGVAFGSLWFSSHPGTSSMGQLLALSLICTLIGAVLFQPALMGTPPTKSDSINQ